MVTEAEVRQALRVVIDPDLHQDIETLGFVRGVVIEGDRVRFEVNLTTPACPAKETLRDAARAAVAALPGVSDVRVHMTATTRGAASNAGEVHEALRGVRHVVAIASGKGGVGKSTTALNLAVALQQAGARVGVLDADLYGPSLVSLTGAGVPETQEGSLLQPVHHHDLALVSLGMFLPPARATLMRGPRLSGMLQQLVTGFAWGELDYLLIDYPPGTGDVQITLGQLAPITAAVLVTTPEEVAVADVRRAATMFKQLDIPVVGLVETMSGFTCTTCGTLHPIFSEGGGDRMAAEIGIPVLGRIPLDPAIVLGGERQVPITRDRPDAPASRAYREAAGQVAAALSRLRHRADGGLEALDHFTLRWEAR